MVYSFLVDVSITISTGGDDSAPSYWKSGVFYPVLFHYLHVFVEQIVAIIRNIWDRAIKDEAFNVG
jgi:hypothetical protein